MMNFFTNNKKLFLVLAFILFSLSMALLIFLVFFKPMFSDDPAVPGETGTTTGSGGFPDARPGSGNITPPDGSGGFPGEGPTDEQNPLVPSAVAQGGLTKTSGLNQTNSLIASPGNNGSDIQYYDARQGKFFQINKNGEVRELSAKVFNNVQTVAWSPTLDKAILEYPDGANILYNFEKDTQVTLPSHWKDFNFSPNGNNIVMKIMGNDEDNRFLAIANDDGSKIRPIEHLGDKDATVYSDWSPNNRVVAMYTEGIDLDKQEVFFIGVNNENFKSAVIEGRGFQPQWSPDGKYLVYSVYSSNSNLKPELWVISGDENNVGAGRKKMNMQTWADKCTFAGNTELYCAVPDSLEEGAGLFPEMAAFTTDRLYKVDIQTGLKKLVAIPDASYNMTNLIISNNGYDLYFTDKTSQQLHKLKIK